MIHDSIILGIDPGYGRVGIAIIKKVSGGEELRHSECFETDSRMKSEERLLLIKNKVREIIKKYRPQKIAVESLLWSKNKKTALRVAESRGVILSEAANAGVETIEINPNTVKLAITGYGKSDKKQVMEMVDRIAKLEPKKRLDDEYDAIAIALTCAYTSRSHSHKEQISTTRQ